MSLTIGGTGAHCGHFIASTTAPWSNAVGSIMLACNCTRAEAFFAYFNLLAFIHDMGRGGKAHATRATIDDKAELPGFAAALERIGWLKFDEPLGTPMRWTWKLRKGYVTKKTVAQMVDERKARGDK